MTAITFDKLVYLETLKASGISEDHARAHAHALDEALRDSVATKADVRAELEPVKLELAAVKAELAMVKLMVGGIGFGVLLLALKSFWPV